MAGVKSGFEVATIAHYANAKADIVTPHGHNEEVLRLATATLGYRAAPEGETDTVREAPQVKVDYAHVRIVPVGSPLLNLTVKVSPTSKVRAEP